MSRASFACNVLAQDCYRGCLTTKLLAFWELVTGRYRADFVVKMEDDVYVNPGRLLLAAQQWTQRQAGYVGCMHSAHHVLRDPSVVDFEPQGQVLGHYYTMYVNGAFVAVNGSVIHEVLLPIQDGLRNVLTDGATFNRFCILLVLVSKDTGE